MKIWLIVGAALVVLGLIVFTVVMTVNHWDFNKLSTVKYITSRYTVSENFTDISIQIDTANVLFVPSEGDVCEVLCHEPENVRHSVAVEDGCLTVRVQDERKWHEYIGIYNGTPKLTVTLPRGDYQSLVVDGSTGSINLPGNFSFERINISGSTGNVECLASASESLKIRVSTGRIRVEDLSAGDVDLQVSTGGITASQLSCTGILSLNTSTGRVTLTDISCGTLTSTGSTGNITLENVTASRDVSIVRSTGDVKLVKCDAAELTITTDTGSVTGTLLSDKVFIAHTDTGRVIVPKTTTGGKCEVTTDTGNILFEIVAE